jgi:hypothetical protein
MRVFLKRKGAMMDRRRLAVPLLVAASLLVARPGAATLRFGPLQISGNLQSQNLIRHPDLDTYQFVQNRNVARLQLTYEFLQGGKAMEKYNIPFIRDAKLFVLLRGVYDSVYDTTPGFLPTHEIHGHSFGGESIIGNIRTRGLSTDILRLRGISRDQRDNFKFKGSELPREMYLDFRLRDVPLNIRAGRQQIVWGETDNFRMLDRANSLDLTWHFQQEIPAPAFGWDEIRQPFWMIKALYELGDVWKFSQSFIEGYWNPGDWRPARQAFLPRPWGLPFMNPLSNPVDGVFYQGVCGTGPNGQCNRLMNDTNLFGQGDWKRNPWDNSQFGVRYHGITPFGFEFTLNYFYQRFGGDDGTNYAPLKGLVNNPANQIKRVDLINQGIFPAEAYNPYVHTIGASGNYSDDTYTGTVFRFETIYDMGVPFFDVAKETVIDIPSLPGITKKDMWKGMVGFDRQTWIRWINKKTTVFLTGQFFWHYLIDNPECNAPTVANASSARKQQIGSCLVGGLDLPSNSRLGTAAAAQAGSPAYRDKIRDWETLITFAAFTFYKGGSIIPTVGIAVDPVNNFSMEPFWAVDYVVRDDFVVNIAQRYFVTAGSRNGPVFETWGLAGLNAGRSETSIRLTYQY